MSTTNRPGPHSNIKIDREYVVSAALSIVDRTGLDSLTIRSLAASIDRDPMTVYRYLPTKQALLDAIADSVLGTLVCVDGADPDWQRQLRIFARHYRELALQHPHAAVLLTTCPQATPLGLGTPRSLASLENILILLTTAGFTLPEALTSYRLMISFLRGHLLSETQETTANPDETGDRLSLALRRLPIDTFPLLSTLPPLITEYDGALELELGLDVLFRGITAPST
ncbi:TetR family transcriptional regulator [Rhodococcus sp. 15-725-2-2b]|uniref:TetR/AcrR family transcriptional regulator C-terminal domain-containing protein n=2 Tax=Rhodococcus TaxID=1827 RepID=A0ABU4AYE8_9NOCA|nr:MULTISPECIES: TetR/AcrR family transcriptional regulator C-terminal domain-containing protein [Rhodococcus]MDI6630487.1 TetR/AcrR family transcriptional regulator C-terminal domain-containing protein [Rhodococcus sp. (in: high G+C Gram-positive bacteria)]MDI9927634.1 TetR/AcrR family transcriptional regulator C-terminal domain-containing protein [Rhodococcus sp. IEGM 1341]MDV6231284.1 TetR/AcrR family transcriptional regulator C-terminal domain-containing protein [Rhodococcus cercidiphylli]M